MPYNYEHFDRYVEAGEEATEFAAFPNHLHVGEEAPDCHVGEEAPDCVLTVLDEGRPQRLSHRWRARTVVMEFGSFT